jgi:hypothetical protein
MTNEASTIRVIHYAIGLVVWFLDIRLDDCLTLVELSSTTILKR